MKKSAFLKSLENTKDPLGEIYEYMDQLGVKIIDTNHLKTLPPLILQLPDLIKAFQDYALPRSADLVLTNGFHILAILHHMRQRLEIVICTQTHNRLEKTPDTLLHCETILAACTEGMTELMEDIGNKLKSTDLTRDELKSILDAYEKAIEEIHDGESKDPIFPWSDQMRTNFNDWLGQGVALAAVGGK